MENLNPPPPPRLKTTPQQFSGKCGQNNGSRIESMEKHEWINEYIKFERVPKFQREGWKEGKKNRLVDYFQELRGGGDGVMIFEDLSWKNEEIKHEKSGFLFYFVFLT